MPNKLTFQQLRAKAEVADAEKWLNITFEQLEELQMHIISDPDFRSSIRDSLRYAPSLIARGDTEMLRLSAPRFAIRVNLDTGGESIVNLRRIIEMRHRHPIGLGKRGGNC